MLVELVVENFAVVERLRLRFHAGLNALTGETGSGKSLVVDALSLLLGGRASAEMVRTGEARSFVSGIFEIPPDPALHQCQPVLPVPLAPALHQCQPAPLPPLAPPDPQAPPAPLPLLAPPAPQAPPTPLPLLAPPAPQAPPAPPAPPTPSCLCHP